MLTLFICASGIHLYFSWRDEPRGRAITKPWLLLLLLLYYISATPSVNLFLALALATSWLGDVLLIPKGHKWFYAGGIAFTFTHIFFMLLFTRHIEPALVPWYVVIPAAVTYCAVSLTVIHTLRPSTPRMLIPPMYVYLFCNGATNVFALMQLFSCRTFAAGVAYVGALLFFVSDCILYLVRYHPSPDLIFKRHFSVMLAYLAGELLIVLGMLHVG